MFFTKVISSCKDKPEKTSFVWRFLADGYRLMLELSAIELLKLSLEYMIPSLKQGSGKWVML